MMPKGKPSVKLGQCYLPGGYLVPELWRDEIQKSLKATHLKVSFEFVWILSGAFLGFLPWRPANFLNASQVRYYQVPKEALRKETSSLNKLLTYLKIFGFQKKTYSKIEGGGHQVRWKFWPYTLFLTNYKTADQSKFHAMELCKVHFFNRTSAVQCTMLLYRVRRNLISPSLCLCTKIFALKPWNSWIV